MFNIIEIIALVLWGIVGIMCIADRIISGQEVPFTIWLCTYIVLMVNSSCLFLFD